MNLHIESETQGDLKIWVVKGDFGTARVAEQGAQLIEYTPKDTPPIIWLSDRASFQTAQSIRGGIPVCWPWFGVLDRNPKEVQSHIIPSTHIPSHGFARRHVWHRDTTLESAACGIGFTLEVDPSLDALWPHHARLSIYFDFSQGLNITLHTTNLNTYPLAISQALHSYFNVSELNNIHISGLLETSFIDTLDDWQHKTSPSDSLTIDQEVDRIYLNTHKAIQINDLGWQRKFIITPHQSRSAVIWNPGPLKSQNLSQYDPASWRKMVCIETANIWDDIKVLAPNERGSLGVAIHHANIPA